MKYKHQISMKIRLFITKIKLKKNKKINYKKNNFIIYNKEMNYFKKYLN